MRATEPLRSERAADARRPTGWLRATLKDVRSETRTARTLVLDVPEWPGHAAGQHVDVKLTAANGYSTERSYSVASPSTEQLVELTVQSLPDGEVSPYLVATMHIGDELELRGPIGGWFQWSPAAHAPVLLVAGGAGIVPLMSMIRERRQARSAVPFTLIYSVASPDQIFYQDELLELSQRDHDLTVNLIFTRQGTTDDKRVVGRIHGDDLPAAPVDEDGPRTRIYVCGPTGFVEKVAKLLVEIGHDPDDIRTERFGPSGG